MEEKTIFIFSFQNQVALLKRENKGLLKGMYEFPNKNQKLIYEEVLNYLKIEKFKFKKIKKLTEAKHIFSHIEWHMIGYYIFLEEMPKNKNYIWSNLEDLNEKYAIPSAFSTYLELIKKEL